MGPCTRFDRPHRILPRLLRTYSLEVAGQKGRMAFILPPGPEWSLRSASCIAVRSPTHAGLSR